MAAKRLILACVTALACAALATAAGAQSELGDPTQLNPYAEGERLVEQNDLPDTDHTPRFNKESELFKQVAGSSWDERKNDPATAIDGDLRKGVVAGSATSFNDNLFTVVFSLQAGKGGFAGGQRCEDPIPNAESGCVPVLFQRKTVDPARGPEWKRVPLPGDEQPGFIGEIAWISDSGRALAVGGTGVYPRRDPGYREECQRWKQLDDAPDLDGDGEPEHSGRRRLLLGAYGELCDPAGQARAWLYNRDGDGAWEELDLAALREPGEVTVPASGTGGTPLPLFEPAKTVPRRGIGGLTALDCDPVPGRELCFAGALGQLWEWKGGRFSGRRIDSYSPRFPGEDNPDLALENARRFVYRVHELRFLAGTSEPLAVAVTAGCCAELPREGAPSVINLGYGRWFAQPLRQRVVGSQATVQSGQTLPTDDPGLEINRPDSLYSFTARADLGDGGSEFRISALATPGGPQRPDEPPSRLTPRMCGQAVGGVASGATNNVSLMSNVADPTRTALGSARLVAGDGDRSVDIFSPLQAINGLETRGSPASLSYAQTGSCASEESQGVATDDSVPDWVVGELRSTERAGYGSRGLLYANPLRPSFTPETIFPPASGTTLNVQSNDIVAGKYEPSSQERLAAWARSPYFLLPSYGLGAIDIVGESASGWAVGDHGAILSLGDEGAGATPLSEPKPPPLGARRDGGLPAIADYERARPVPTSKPGLVSPLALRSRLEFAEPTTVAAGAPDSGGPGGQLDAQAGSQTSVRDLAMSRDGSEGWAVGPEAPSIEEKGATTLYRYRNGGWQLCEMTGVPGELEPDPACAEIGAIASFPDAKGTLHSVHLRAIARVPLEADSDPDNDDEFEAVAVGSGYLPDPGAALEPVMMRYRDGRWRFEDAAARVAITAGTTGDDFSGGFSGATVRGLRDVAFRAPDDGWALASAAGTVSLFHFDGSSWRGCEVDPTACSDAERRLGDPAARSSGIGTVSFSGPGRGGGPEGLGLAVSGRRLYLYGTREEQASGTRCPAIIYHEAGAASWSGSADGSNGSYDPGYDPATHANRACDLDQRAELNSFAVGRRADGAHEGWALGAFGQSALRLGADDRWRPHQAQDALTDYPPDADQGVFASPLSRTQLMLARPDGGLDAYLVERGGGRLLHFDRDVERWRVTGSGSDAHRETALISPTNFAQRAGASLLAPDNQGGIWIVRGVPRRSGASQHFLRYTTTPPEPVFVETPVPSGTQVALTAIAAGRDGQVWLGGASDTLYRYDPAVGWDRIKIPGWIPGRVAPKPAAVRAIALNGRGVGIAVGDGGRIADLEPGGVRLDDAAGTLCDLTKLGELTGPCGTSRELRAAAVSPEGAALVGGENLALLWRPPGGAFRAIERPDAAAQTLINAVSLPRPDRAWIATDTGVVFAGTLEGGHWRWELETLSERGDLLGRDVTGRNQALLAIALDADGNGFAAGYGGVVLQREQGRAQPWRRIEGPARAHFSALVLAPGGLERGALLGAERGAIYTWTGERFELAQPAFVNGDVNSHAADRTIERLDLPVVGFALSPGYAEGQVEAWAAIRGGTISLLDGIASGGPNSALLHHASDPAESLLSPVGRASAQPDVPAPRPGELTLGAFGGTRCVLGRTCADASLTTEASEVFTQGTIEALAERARRRGGLELALFTGDATDTVGMPTASGFGEFKLRRFAELVAGRLAAKGVALFGAIGGGDTSTLTRPCVAIVCEDLRSLADYGENLAWRRAMEPMPAPWGRGKLPAGSKLAIRPVADSPLAVEPKDAGAQADQTADGARTHYAFDLVDPETNQRRTRLVFVDSSFRSLAAADPQQNPLEADGGQASWLVRVLCTRGQASATGRCTRPEGVPAVVVSNAPTYSYGPGSTGQTQTDGAAFEQILFDYDANLVVSGRIGWSGLYWATAAGVHEPCPGEHYRTEPPKSGARLCGRSSGLPADPSAIIPQANSLSAALGSSAPDAGQLAGELTAPGVLPFVVASGSGRLADESGSASDGFWHGYSVIRLGATGELIVEQRPLLKWLRIAAEEHTLRPGQKMTLKGYGRELSGPLAPDSRTVREIAIDSPAVTHRYNLVEADPQKPWLPKREEGQDPSTTASPGGDASAQDDNRGAYVPFDPSIATIDPQTGLIQTGKGNRERTFAIGMLSVGCVADAGKACDPATDPLAKVATYPLIFESRRTFKPVVVTEPRVTSLQARAGASLPPPPQAPPAGTAVQPLNLPPPPAPPALPPIDVPKVNAPSPPVPPPPPIQQSPVPLDLSASAPGVTIAPQTTVIPPPAPPIQPAPPGGARREARQRQSATQSSGSGADQVSSEISEGGGDLAQSGPDRSAMTRRTTHEFTATGRARADGGSMTAYYGAGVTLLALIAAFGWNYGRPTPRRRTPYEPAPGWSRVNRRF